MQNEPVKCSNLVHEFYLTCIILNHIVNRTIYQVNKMITANDLKIKGIACLEESLADSPEAVITVRGKECFVVMKIEHYHYLREMELEAALYETQQDVAAGRFSKGSVDQHVAELFAE